MVEAACTGKRCDVDRSRSCFDEGLRGSASSSTCRENVVDQQYVLALDGGWIGDPEGTADVVAALAWGQSGLTLSGAQAHESGGRERQAPSGMRSCAVHRWRTLPGLEPG